MDRTDRILLSALELDGRQSLTALAERINLSKTPVWSRVHALENAGTIEGYRAILNPHAIGLQINAFVHVVTRSAEDHAFQPAVVAHPSILACYSTAGEEDYVLHVVAKDVEALDRILRKEISRLPGVERCRTTICMAAIKQGGSLMQAAAPRDE